MRGDGDLTTLVHYSHHFPAIPARLKFLRVLDFLKGILARKPRNNSPCNLLTLYSEMPN